MLLTRHNRNSLQRPQHPKGPQPSQVADLHADSGISRRDHDEVQPIPRVPEVRILVQDETLGDALDYHLRRVDRQENVPGKKKFD